MSLIDDLKAAAHALDPQFQVSSNEVQGVASALVHYIDKGDEFLKAAEGGIADVTNLLAPPPPEGQEPQPSSAAGPDAPAPAADAPSASGPSVEELQAQVSDLEAQLAARKATEQQTQVQHEPGAGDVPPAAV